MDRSSLYHTPAYSLPSLTRAVSPSNERPSTRLSVDNGEQPLADTLDAVEADPTLARRFGARIAREGTAAKVRVDAMRADVAALDDVADEVEAVISHLVSTPESDAAADEVRRLISLSQPANLRDLMGAISLRGNEEEDIAPTRSTS